MDLSKTNDSGLQILWEDGERVVCREWCAHPDGNRSAVLVVRPAAENPAPATLARFAHEYGLRDELDDGWAARPLDLVRDRGQVTLVLEDPEAEPLERLLGAPMETGRFLRLAVGIVSALGKAHQRGLVHKDLKPVHVLVNRESGQIWLTGFGIASRLPSERQAPEPPETIAGTLAYMAPEQTGRMNRSVDARSDLYALGVTFYQMVTGKLPFTAADPMEWVHCHIARQPVPPDERLSTVSKPVSAIVMKLLAKAAEERYQTAAGVERDLRRCLAEWERRGRIDDFSLGQQDTPDRLLIPEKLYGREREIAALLAAFDRAVWSGGPELVLVSGYSGIGKSSVVSELHKVLVPPRGLFAAGKFDQYKRDIPYATLAQALQGLVRPLLGKSDAVLAPWREALREALGQNGQLMVDLVPALEPLLGPQPPVSELPPQDAQRRFQLVFRRLLGVFARPEHPLALFLDDLQWLDMATLDLLEHLATRPELRNLLLVGAYRDNEVTPTHPLTRRLAAIRGAGGRVQEIVLGPLRLGDVGRLIADALRGEPERVAPLARLVHEKAAGNPFFTLQFLTALVDEGLLTFDHGMGRWSWELDRIRAKGYTDNVADLMLGKLRRLPTATQHALRLLACLGNSAAISTLALVRGESSEEALHAALWAAARAGLVVQLDGLYRFLHDRVQEAAYGLIPTGERAGEHLRIGRLLAAHMTAEAIDEHVFEIVSQLNRGAVLLTAGEERERLAELNLLAGKRAKAATAYTSALTYFVAGEALLSEDCWQRRRELAFALALNRAECEFLTGALAAAENRLTALSRRAGDLLELAAVTCLQADLYTTLDRSDRSIEVALDYLRRVGVAWSAHPTQDEVRREHERMWQQIGGRPIEALLDLPRMTDLVWRATMDVLAAVVSPAMYTDQNLYCVVLGRMANLSLEHGNTDASSSTYAILGAVLGGLFGDYKAGFRFGQLGFNLMTKLGLDRFKTRVYLFFGHHILPWTKPIRSSRSLIQLALDASNETGDILYGTFARTHLVTHLLASGDPLEEVQRKAEAGLDDARRARFGIVVDRITGQLQLIRMLRGLTPTFGRFDDTGFDEMQFEQHLQADPRLALATCWYWTRKLQACVLAGDYGAAVVAAAQAERLLWTSPFYFERAEYHFYAALARAALCDAAADAERTGLLEALAVHYRQLQEWAENCPENFENRAALVGAEIARLDGHDREAMDLYEQALRSARANGFVHNEAIANELAARFYEERGFETISHAYLRNARYCYGRWGAEAKVRQIDQAHPRLNDELLVAGPTSTIGTPVEHLDLATVIKVSQAVSGEIVLERLIDTLLRTAVAQAGAERGLLILSHGAEQRITAEATLADTVGVQLRDELVTAKAAPESVLQYVLRTRESVILDDAATDPAFAADPYIRQRQAQSILCLPLITRSKLIGVLYLENNLAPHVFTPTRIAVLKLLASQAAISLENTRLYRELAQREAKIRRLVDANIIGIFIWDFDGQILEANDAFLRMLGYDREDFAARGLRWTDLTPPEWSVRIPREVAELRATGTIQPFEKGYFRKDRSRVPVLIGAATFEEARDQGVAFVLDLTERKRAEQHLIAHHAVTRILAEAATFEEATPKILHVLCESLGWDHGVLWRIDQQAGVLRCAELWRAESSDAAEFEAATRASTFRRGFGLPGRVWESREPACIPDVAHDPTFLRADAAKSEGLHAAFAFPIMLGSEVLGVIDFVSRHVRLPDQDLLDLMATIGSQIGQFMDRKHAENALQLVQAELTHVTRVMTVGELTASIAHEINQPLGAITADANACLRWLAREPPNLDEAEASVQRMIHSSSRAAEVVTRIRSLIKKSPPVKSRLDLNEAIQEVVALVDPEARRHAVQVSTDLAANLPAAHGDRVQLQQVMLNLVMNGIEAMKEVENRPRELWIRSRPHQPGGVLLSVQDTGIGLTENNLERLFDAFYTTKAEGMGMGLSISRSIIAAHGGELWPTPNAEHGATFQFTLPTNDTDGGDTAKAQSH